MDEAKELEKLKEEIDELKKEWDGYSILWTFWVEARDCKNENERAEKIKLLIFFIQQAKSFIQNMKDFMQNIKVFNPNLKDVRETQQ